MRTKAAKRKLRLNTPAEDRRIRAGIKADPDTRELTAGDFAQMRPFSEVKRGRPKSDVHKTPVTVRLDPEIVDYFRGTGDGWQTRLNEALAEYVQKQKRAA